MTAPAPGDDEQFRLDGDSAHRDVTQVVRHVLDRARHHGLPAEAAARLRLAVEELATNIAVHGYRGHPAEVRPLTVSDGRCDDGTVWVRLADLAPPFDPTAAPPPADLDAPLEQRWEGGLGIFLASQSLDVFRYERSRDANVVTLGVRPGAGGTAATGPGGDRGAGS
ncbi:MAG: ATP-binding protein [Kineosporiaceae bacterium]